MSGDRKGFPGIEPYPEIGRNLASYGIGMVLVSYRLGPAHHWPTMAQDVAAAVGWTKRKIGTYGGDTTRIFLAGHSSGGHLASVVATDQRFLHAIGMRTGDLAGCIVMSSSLHPSYDIEDLPEADILKQWEWARAVGAYESIFPTPNDYRDADPCRHVNPDAPRFLIIFGEDETRHTPALEHADLFTGLLSRQGVRSSVDVIENRDHIGLLRRMAEEGDPAVMLIRSFVMKHARR
jgi:acetyl esterase/lipase